MYQLLVFFNPRSPLGRYIGTCSPKPPVPNPHWSLSNNDLKRYVFPLPILTRESDFDRCRPTVPTGEAYSTLLVPYLVPGAWTRWHHAKTGATQPKSGVPCVIGARSAWLRYSREPMYSVPVSGDQLSVIKGRTRLHTAPGQTNSRRAPDYMYYSECT
jgi:hypothetical protein